jgi:hypothetical protein
MPEIRSPEDSIFPRPREGIKTTQMYGIDRKNKRKLMRKFFVRRRNPTCEETLGVCAPMAATGVLNHDPWAASIDTNHWVRVKKMVKRAELLFESFAGSEVLDHIQRAKGVVPFKRMHAPHCNQAHAKYFGAIAFGCNVFLHCHDDDDFTLSMAHVILGGKEQYNLDDEDAGNFGFRHVSSFSSRFVTFRPFSSALSSPRAHTPAPDIVWPYIERNRGCPSTAPSTSTCDSIVIVLK